jgi:hypothetical protein
MAHLPPLGRSEATPRHPVAAEADQPTLRHSRTTKSSAGSLCAEQMQLSWTAATHQSVHW